MVKLSTTKERQRTLKKELSDRLLGPVAYPGHIALEGAPAADFLQSLSGAKSISQGFAGGSCLWGGSQTFVPGIDSTKPRYGDLLENHSAEDWVCPNLSHLHRQWAVGFVHLELEDVRGSRLKLKDLPT